MRKLAMLTIVLALLVAACSPGGEEESTTSVPGGTGSTAAPTETTAPEATTTTTAPTTTTTEPPSSAGADCVTGTWLLDIQSFISLMQEAFTSEGLGADSIKPNEGTYLVTLAPDGTFTAERDEWGFTVVTGDGTFTLSVNGTETGTWSADDTTITVSVDSSDVKVSTTAEVNGQVIEMPDSPVDVPDAVAEDSAYTCNGDVLTVTTEDVAITLNRT
jgi:hypothetical protein